MTANKQEKKAAREWAKRNQSYTAGLRAVRAKRPPSFREILLRTISLAEDWRQELAKTQCGKAIPPTDGIENEFRRLAEYSRRFHHEHPLCQFLRSQGEAVACKLQTLMYAGRDGIRDEQDLLELHAHLETTNAPTYGSTRSSGRSRCPTIYGPVWTRAIDEGSTSSSPSASSPSGTDRSQRPQQRLYLRPEPQGHGLLRPTFGSARRWGFTLTVKLSSIRILSTSASWSAARSRL